MATIHRSFLLTAAILAMPLSLTACGGEPDNDAELAELDDNLTDPAMNDALSDQILVDPELAGQANSNALRGAREGANGAMPAGTPSGSAEAGRAAALAQIGKGKMMSAPKPRQMTSDDECSGCGGDAQPMTLGAKAEAQGSCNAQVSYDMGWAERMPAAFPVFPRANLKEAAGVDGGKCDLRVVSFTTPVDMKSVVNFYYTKAKRSGYSAEYLLRGDEHVLGGVRDADDAAYVITLNALPSGGLEVDIVASNGG